MITAKEAYELAIKAILNTDIVKKLDETIRVAVKKGLMSTSFDVDSIAEYNTIKPILEETGYNYFHEYIAEKYTIYIKWS